MNLLKGTIIFSIILFSCKKQEQLPGVTPVIPAPLPTDTLPSSATIHTWLVDKKATEQTVALFYNLKKIAATKILFGHQDDTKRGVINAATQWANEQQFTGISKDKSDVKEVTGAYPAVYGHDFIHIANFTSGNWFDYEAKIARELTIDAYNRGGVNTYAWHYSNPVSRGSFYWDQSPVEAVSKILPGGSYHNVYKASLKVVADFAKSLTGADGNTVPVIFRPFHEFDGDWFWWGKAHCSAADYKSLYQFTVGFLRDSLGVHNFLYAWSPDKNFTSETQYLERYPGDDYVDVVGSDNYGDLSDASSPQTASAKLKIVSDYGKSKNKIAAMTETGSGNNLSRPDWYTGLLLQALKAQQLQLAYVLVWANTKTNYYTPFKGHAAEADFIKFRNDPYMIFGDKVGNMYQVK